MRLQYFVVAVAAVLLASGATPSSASVVQVPPAARKQGNVLLRNLKTKTRDEDEDEDEEERAGGNLAKVDDAVVDVFDDVPSLMKMFKRWGKLTVEEKLSTAGLANLPEKRFMEVWDMYGLYKALGPEAFLARLQRIKAKAHPTRT